MKRLFSFLLCILLVLSLSACAPSGYLNSTDGDLNISLPERQDNSPEFTDEQRLIIGQWKLISITNASGTVEHTDSSYTFTEKGKCIVNMKGVKTDGGFYFKDDLLYIDKAPVTYKIENDTLTITTAAGAVHILEKIAAAITE